MPINYSSGKVYKIINENNEIVYIGSTAQELLCNRYKNHTHKAPNHKIILIENYACNSRQELCMREQQIIEEYSDLLNKQKAYRSKEYKKQYDKEWRENNQDRMTEYRKEFYENNKDIINQKNKEYYEKNKNEILEKQKEYREKNQENITEYKKEYYQENKNEILEKQKVKVNCPHCNCEMRKNSLKRHLQSQKCLKFQKS